MVQFNFTERTIKAKVVYYGPAQSGKTTNLEQIHRITDPKGNNRLISLNTAQDRTLFFDLLPFSLGAVSGYDFKVQLYTVPGQVQYNATRRVVLAGADAVVFVADSRKSMFRDNLSAFENMKVNLLANRLVPEKVPLVLQFNKQDLPDLQSEAELRRALNPWGRPCFLGVASQGEGVMETFLAVVQEMLGAIAVKYNLKEKGLDPAAVPDIVAAAFSSLLNETAKAAPPTSPASPPSPSAPPKVVISPAMGSESAAPLQATPQTGLVSEELLHRAIRSNVELAEALAGLVRDMNLGLGTILSHAELLMLYRDEAREKRATAIASIQQEASRLRRIMQELGLAGAAASSERAHASPRPLPAASSAAPGAFFPADATPPASGPAGVAPSARPMLSRAPATVTTLVRPLAAAHLAAPLPGSPRSTTPLPVTVPPQPHAWPTAIVSPPPQSTLRPAPPPPSSVTSGEASIGTQAAAVAVPKPLAASVPSAGSLPPRSPGAAPSASIPPRPPPAAPAAVAIAAPAASLDILIREAASAAQSGLDGRGVLVELRVPPGTAPPRVPPPSLQRALARLFHGIGDAAGKGSTIAVRCERKPVLLRSRDGSEVRRDFLMLALSHSGILDPAQQQRVLQGGAPGPLSEACRLVREMGGFVRFAALSANGMETRLFLPAP